MLTVLVASALLAQATPTGVQAGEQETPAAAPAASAPMIPGSPAPVPQIEHVVRGTAPKFFEPGKTYVIEFWATWCGPCRASMPHLSDLNDKYAGKVAIVGISDEPLEKVTKFLDTDEWKQKARYVLATDPDASVHNDYMRAAGQNGIPCAFIVKDNTVQWIGHPMAMDEPLEKVVAGTWNVAEAKAAFLKEQEGERAMMELQTAMVKAMREAMTGGDWGPVVTVLDKAIADDVGGMGDQLRVQKFMILLGPADKPDEGYALGRELLRTHGDNAQMLNHLAWFVMDEESVTKRDLNFAKEAALAAAKASENKNASILDTLARAYWETGDQAKAVATQKQALSVVTPDDPEEMVDEMKANLAKYERSKAPGGGASERKSS